MTTTMTATSTNGPVKRKQLSDQLDRLDGIIDVLAEALPGAVADACREGARQAVRDAVIEILASPELRTLIAGPAAARISPSSPVAPDVTPAAESGPAKPGFSNRLRAKVSAAKAATVKRAAAAVTAVTTTARTLTAMMPLRKFLVVGAGVGLAVGLVSYACPHGLSAVVSGVGGALMAVGVQVGRWVRRSAAAFGPGTG